MVHLQRILLGPHLPLDEGNHNQVEEVFNRVIFPLLDELLKQQVFMRDPMGMPETRLRASALLCKVFMQFEARDGQTADIRVLWIQVLDLLDRLMHVDRRDQLVRLRRFLWWRWHCSASPMHPLPNAATPPFQSGAEAAHTDRVLCPCLVRSRARVAQERIARDERHRPSRPAKHARGRPGGTPGRSVGCDARAH